MMRGGMTIFWMELGKETRQIDMEPDMNVESEDEVYDLPPPPKFKNFTQAIMSIEDVC